MGEKTPFAGLHKIGTYLDEDLPNFNANVDIIDAQLKQGHDERQQEAQTRATDDAAIVKALEAESQARGKADTALQEKLDSEANARSSEDTKLLESMDTAISELEQADAAETNARVEGDNREAEARATALSSHDDNADAHAALVRRITVGDISPIIGVCQLETGNCAGLWYNVDGEGQPVTPNTRYFDYHPVYSAMRQIVTDGQSMVRNVPFWFKNITPSSGPFSGKPCRIIAPGQTDGFRPYPAFLNASGKVADALYVGAFMGTDEGGSKIGSRAGKLPIVSLDFPTMRTRCTNRNTGGVAGFRMWDIYHYEALCNLFLIEFATPESQSLIGRGHVDSGGATYTNADNQPRWRGYVGLWGNVWQMVDGIRLTPSRQIEVFRNDGSQNYVNTGKASPSYDGANPAYMITTHTGAGDGFNCDDMFLPATQTTSYTAGTFPDYFYGGSGSAGNVLYVGGNWGNGSGAGLFCRYLSYPASYSDTGIGCRLAKI